MRTILTTAAALFVTGCSFNSVYLKPTKLPPIPAGKDQVTITSKSDKDTTVVLFDAKTLQPTFLNTKNDTMRVDYTIESVRFKSTSGHLLNGWFLKPKNSKPAITLLHFHGNAGFLLSNYKAMTPLLPYGFQAFVFDYSGFGFSEGKATRDQILIDGNAALTYIKSRADVQNTKVVLYGQSLGGHLSAVVAAQRQSEIDALVMEGAFSSHKDIAAAKAGFFGRMLVSEKYAASDYISEYKKPLLLIHSTEDEIIPFAMGQKILARANQPKSLYEIQKCHICGTDYYADSIAQKIKKMVE